MQVLVAYSNTQTIDLTAVNDSFNETNETLVITLSAAPGAHHNIDSTNLGDHNITITDDDTALTSITITGATLSPPVSPATTAYTATAPYNITQVTTSATPQYPTETWAVTTPLTDADTDIDGHQTDLQPENTTDIVVTATAEDGLTTKDYTVTVTRSPAVVSVSSAQDDITEGAPAVFTIQRDVASTQETIVTITLAETGATIDEASVSTTFTIPADQTGAQLSIPTQDDTTYESDSDVTLTITDGNGYNPSASPDNSATVKVKDNDTPTGTATTFDAGQTLTIDEDETSINISLTVNTGADRTNADITVDLSTTEGTGPTGATENSDYTAADATMTFTPTDFSQEDGDSPWTATKTWPITITNDTLDEDTESFTVQADANTGADPLDLTVRIRDNEVGLNTLTLTNPSTDVDQQIAAGTTAYTASTPSTSTSVQVNATATHSGTTEVEGANPKPLTTGDNDVTIQTVAEDTTTKVPYTLTIRRLSADATLKSVALANATPSADTNSVSVQPLFVPATTAYTAIVTSDITHLSLAVETNHTGATAVVSKSGVTIADPSSVPTGTNGRRSSPSPSLLRTQQPIKKPTPSPSPANQAAPPWSPSW